MNALLDYVKPFATRLEVWRSSVRVALPESSPAPPYSVPSNRTPFDALFS